jgi:hypothetical protein
MVGGVALALWLGILVWGSLAVVMPGLPAWDPMLIWDYVPILGAAAFVGGLIPTVQAMRASLAGMLAEAS